MLFQNTVSYVAGSPCSFVVPVCADVIFHHFSGFMACRSFFRSRGGGRVMLINWHKHKPLVSLLPSPVCDEAHADISPILLLASTDAGSDTVLLLIMAKSVLENNLRLMPLIS